MFVAVEYSEMITADLSQRVSSSTGFSGIASGPPHRRPRCLRDKASAAIAKSARVEYGDNPRHLKQCQHDVISGS